MYISVDKRAPAVTARYCHKWGRCRNIWVVPQRSVATMPQPRIFARGPARARAAQPRCAACQPRGSSRNDSTSLNVAASKLA
jgi:hypothetical protein